jgi:hypothetical protein
LCRIGIRLDLQIEGPRTVSQQHANCTNYEIKVKEKLSLFLIKHYAVKTHGGMDVQIHVLLTSAVVGVE